MPIVAKYKSDKNTIVVWYIAEPYSHLQQMLIIDDFVPFKNEKRNTHWLAARIALQEVLPPKDYKIIKNIHGKPYLDNSNEHISITHSGNMAAAVYNSESLCGIDLEKYDNRISKIAYKFSTVEETDLLNSEFHDTFCCLIWSGKETVFKYSPLTDIDFKEHIKLTNIDIKKSVLHFCLKKNDNICLDVNFKIFEIEKMNVIETELKNDYLMNKKEHYILTWL